MGIFTIILLSVAAVSVFMGCVTLFLFYLWGFPPALIEFHEKVLSSNLAKNLFRSTVFATQFGAITLVFTIIMIYFRYNGGPEENIAFISWAITFAFAIGFTFRMATSYLASKPKGKYHE
jgi:hypothetical protein